MSESDGAPARTASARLPRRRSRPRGPGADVFWRLVRSPVAVASILLVLGFVAVAAGAEQVAPHDPTQMNAGKFSLPPVWVPGTRGVRGGDPAFLLGTDSAGRDVLSRVIYGTRPALITGVLAAALSAALGTVIGLVAGYARPVVGEAIMRVTDVFYAFPAIMSYILLLLYLPESPFKPVITPATLLIIPFVIVNWVGAARLVRAQVLALKEEPFVEAARSVGAGDLRILLRHVLPACLGMLFTWMAFAVPRMIVAEAILGYLRIGVTPEQGRDALFAVTWGGLFAEGRQTLFSNPTLIFAPAIGVALLSMAFTFLGDSLRDALDPRARTQAGQY